MVDARKMIEEILDNWCFVFFRKETIYEEFLVALEAAFTIYAQAKLTCVENKYRKLLWLNHGHMNRLYGDDGEMQCGVCDFKRGPLENLEAHYAEAQMEVARAFASLGKNG